MCSDQGIISDVKKRKGVSWSLTASPLRFRTQHVLSLHCKYPSLPTFSKFPGWILRHSHCCISELMLSLWNDSSMFSLVFLPWQDLCLYWWVCCKDYCSAWSMLLVIVTHCWWYRWFLEIKVFSSVKMIAQCYLYIIWNILLNLFLG